MIPVLVINHLFKVALEELVLRLGVYAGELETPWLAWAFRIKATNVEARCAFAILLEAWIEGEHLLHTVAILCLKV